MRSRVNNRRGVLGLVLLAGVVVVLVAGWMLFSELRDPGQEEFPALDSSPVVEAPNGHAYQYVAAPNIRWDAARAGAAKRTYKGRDGKGRHGYLATIDDRAEFDFILQKIFPDEDTDVTYIGGRQTAPGEWRWVTGPDSAADGGKGLLFWQGTERGHAPDGRFALWMFSAFQHGGKWDVAKVCCVTLFSYRRRMFSTSLGNGDSDEGVAGYLVEFGE
jgi:hypothetical protein